MNENTITNKKIDNEIHITTILAQGEDKKAIEQASQILKNKGLVAFPTETVYGLGADALDTDASAKIYAAKGRPSDNPLIVHIADTEAVYELAAYVPEKAKLLMEAFWPGPLTIILPKKDIVPDGTTGGLNTVAIRMPSHPVALTLIKESGLYIAAPSANTSGRPSPTLASHVMEDMDGRIDMVLNGGAVGIGIESTIVDLSGCLTMEAGKSDECTEKYTEDFVPVILRPGFITKSMLEEIVGEVSIDPALIKPDKNLRPKAPGMKYTHYAPRGELTIVEGIKKTDETNSTHNLKNEHVGNQACVDKINELAIQKKLQGYKVAVIGTSENANKYNCENVLIVGDRSHGETIASKLYAVLRQCDELNVDYIYSESFNEGELGGAIMNRLLKAAGHRVIEV